MARVSNLEETQRFDIVNCRY